MATRLAWLLNFDADLELQDPARYLKTQRPPFDAAALTLRFTDLVADHDIVLSNQLRELPPDLTVLAFSPTPSALARITALGLEPPTAPAAAVLRRVNDRAFCAELGHGLPNSCFARDMVALERHLASAGTGSSVIKRAFSFAGREQRRVQQGVLDDSTRGFCARSFARGEGVQVEPWLERIADFSRHGYITRAGALLVGPVREQRCDAMGRFEGVMTTAPSATEEDEQALLASVQSTGAALKQAGYFGPFGIDAFRYRTPDGGLALNPRCEINARFTMGYPRSLLVQGLAAEGTHVGEHDGSA